ncbi:HET-domain-containing protein, partial [Sporormia fimetaria CBS 119925]
MRLIDAATLKLHNFTSSPTGTPAYAILSHTWGPSEVGFRELRDLGVSVRAARERTMSKAGYYKIKKCCSQALEDGLKWVWVDTCCIDKRSSAELSEAINSMFQWYRNAVKCYAYLDDIDIYGPTRSGRRESISSDARLGAQIGIISEQELSKARWFTRGWTLQELIAPKRVIFYDRAWIRLGDKFTMKKKLSRITGIGESVLETGNLDTETICQRMTWASCRRTTRVEDIAYCLMGIFDVNMPLLYGEGEKAFVRLQEEIMKDSDDETLFAWN